MPELPLDGLRDYARLLDLPLTEEVLREVAPDIRRFFVDLQALWAFDVSGAQVPLSWDLDAGLKP